jgi:hypothetical protein
MEVEFITYISYIILGLDFTKLFKHRSTLLIDHLINV